jgi:transmembrane sensor
LLEGEAFFDVKHDDQKPFQVKAGKTLTNVLGTAFNISSYDYREKIKVTVARGKVAVNNNILLPNQQLAYNKATGKLEKIQLESDMVISWMQGNIVFNDESLKAITKLLENKYNVEISFADQQMSASRFTGKFEPTDSLYDILDALTLTRGLTYKAKGAVIVINH